MPARGTTDGERLAALQATVDAFRAYETDKWHKLANDMSPLLLLPERLTRDVSKIDGKFEGRINSVVKDLERAITEAVEKAVEPISQKQTDHDKRLDTLEARGNMITGAKLLVIFLIQTCIAALTALAGAFEFSRGHP